MLLNYPSLNFDIKNKKSSLKIKYQLNEKYFLDNLIKCSKVSRNLFIIEIKIYIVLVHIYKT